MAITNKVFPLPSSEPDELLSSLPDEQPNKGGADPALNLIRQKVAHLYADEPSMQAEETEIEQLGALSKHQKFIQQLMDSGQDIARMQTAWHEYYQSLPDAEKHEVWQEFYANHQRGAKLLNQVKPIHQPSVNEKTNTRRKTPKVSYSPIGTNVYEEPKESALKPDTTAIDNLKNHLLNTVSSRGRLSKKQHVQSLLFGVGMGVFAILILMFGFFNERFIAPFITPSKVVGSTPIIVDPTLNNAVAPDPLVIIPKINVEIPVVYDVASIDDKAIGDGLLRGVLHYPTSPVPGQNGNVVVVGHSSNNIFNRGKYKFAFVLLSRLEVGDTFMLNYNSKRYIYKVYNKKIVPPSDVSVLGPADKVATATLITCDPPGTANNRLVVIGEQISPTSDNNIAAAPTTTATEQPTEVPGNAESLFHRLFGWIWD